MYLLYVRDAYSTVDKTDEDCFHGDHGHARGEVEVCV
jgi:hypothetical protein